MKRRLSIEKKVAAKSLIVLIFIQSIGLVRAADKRENTFGPVRIIHRSYDNVWDAVLKTSKSKRALVRVQDKTSGLISCSFPYMPFQHQGGGCTSKNIPRGPDTLNIIVERLDQERTRISVVRSYSGGIIEEDFLNTVERCLGRTDQESQWVQDP